MEPDFEPIADGLAERGFAIVHGFLTPAEVADIVQLDSFTNHAASFRKAGIGKDQQKQINEAVRGDYIHWIDKKTALPELVLYLERLQQLTVFLNRSLFLSLKDFEIHMTVYPPGAFYKRHIDQFKKDDHRILSVICYLNKNWVPEDGGQLRLYLEDGPLDILPTAGTLVCFRSDQLEHEVLLAGRTRLSLTGWILDRYADIGA
ncbi:MAG TPA: 2OG-Fe(II) oxygenase [Chryseolinea sp.]|nr:2OG-Fe(II) oxygenase [Chryseolinea sp.]